MFLGGFRQQKVKSWFSLLSLTKIDGLVDTPGVADASPAAGVQWREFTDSLKQFVCHCKRKCPHFQSRGWVPVSKAEYNGGRYMRRKTENKVETFAPLPTETTGGA